MSYIRIEPLTFDKERTKLNMLGKRKLTKIVGIFKDEYIKQIVNSFIFQKKSNHLFYYFHLG